MRLKKQTKQTEDLNIKRVFLCILTGYAILAALFYFLAGDQLHYRSSRGNAEPQPADMGSIELTEGTSVEQRFSVKIDRLESVAVQWGTFYRQNAGTVLMELVRDSDGAVLLRREFDAAAITEGQSLSMETVEAPIEDICGMPLTLRITSDSPPGMGATPMICTNAEAEGFALRINGEAAEGMLCFSASGEDYIWTGKHYWKFALAFGAVLGLVFFIAWKRFAEGRRSYFISAMLAMKKYKFLIDQLVSRDFKTRYKRSVLGVFWSFLNPLLMMLVQYFVFSTIFRNDIPNYAAYLIIGVVMFNFFSEACGQALTSIIGNASLITKVYMPKYIYPLTRTMMSVINLVISLAPLFIVCLLTGVQFKKSALLALYFMTCLVVFSLGLGMLLATSMVFFRDTQFLWGVMSLMWMYITPVFYPETILSNQYRGILQGNPLYFFLKNARVCILNGISPEPLEYVRCALIAMGMFLVGALVFRRHQNKFVLYL